MFVPSRAALKAILILCILLTDNACWGQPQHRTDDPASLASTYVSPYRTAFLLPRKEVEVGFDQSPWNDDRLQASIPYEAWYTNATRKRWGSWGPTQRRYPEAPGWSTQSLRWLQERVLRVALRFQGLSYQHHHIPAWDPPSGWPWTPVTSGHNGPGLDCSNFTAFVYNYALGVKMSTGIQAQASQMEIAGPGESGMLPLQRVDKQDYNTTVKQLQPADLLYIRNDNGDLAHVVLWLGDIGVSPDGTPLVIDSTGTLRRDGNRQSIPDGVQIRPFSRTSWYWRGFSHAHRVVSELNRIAPGPIPDLSEEDGADRISIPEG